MLLETDHDILRERFRKYTREAFQMLPKLEKPRILDVGCGSGVVTLELAMLSEGEIVGVDIDREALDRLSEKIEKADLGGRVKTMECSLFDLKLPDESFDIIWAEGSIAVIGFERGLREWRSLIKPGGFLAVHDEFGDVTQKLALIPKCGYELIGYFLVAGEVWLAEYYSPLERRIQELRDESRGDPKALLVLEKEQQGVDEFKKSVDSNGSAFFVMRKS